MDALSLAAHAGDPSGMSANVAVIGRLSTLSPFSSIPKSAWLDTLDSLAKNEAVAMQNRRTFEIGRL
jgi:hypothetical protein